MKKKIKYFIAIVLSIIFLYLIYKSFTGCYNYCYQYCNDNNTIIKNGCCIKCPTNYHSNTIKTICINNDCKNDEITTNNPDNICLQCPISSNIDKDLNICVPKCNEEYIFKDGECKSCLYYQKPDEKQLNCVLRCGGNNYYDQNLKACIDCGDNRIVNDIHTECKYICSSDFIVTSEGCVQCPYGQEPNNNQSECQFICPEGKYFSGSKTNQVFCFDCPTGQSPNIHRNGCDNICLGNQTYNTETGQCYECPAGQIPNLNHVGCKLRCEKPDTYFNTERNLCECCPEGVPDPTQTFCVV